MKPLTCEMCGSTNILKQDGVFVCQSCGTKYSVEEAKKMMVEGVVNIEGKVKIDQSDKIPNLLSLAQNAIDSLNVDEAESYVNRILEIDCDNAQAWFIKMKAIGLSSSIDNLRVTEIISAGKKAIEKSNGELEIDVYGFYITVLNVNLQSFTEQLQNTGALKQIYEMNCMTNPFKASELTAESDEISFFIMNQYELLLNLRYVIPDDKVANEDLYCLVEFAATNWINFTQAVNARFNVFKWNLNEETVVEFRSILNRIKQGLPTASLDAFDEEHISNPSSGPCYIATVVYGTYDCPEVWTLRRFRDYTLAETWYGRAFIRTYYAVSPTLVKWVGNTAIFKRICLALLDGLVRKLQVNGVESTPYKDRIFK
ncbi:MULTISPECIES: CFI-box-CTERM domain-containing protein [Muribaculaceae]|jgi:uncharacterized Zn finger protein (UPF0148 family)|uniref:CFI-box-CTERM domain-containing protein n=2 Tax=Bacteroidales TaxID=171549 RepID=UPI0025A5FA62|nr:MULTISPECIES: CFI-box-CTERM domain-containing protein [Muribaculaceae]